MTNTTYLRFALIAFATIGFNTIGAASAQQAPQSLDIAKTQAPTTTLAVATLGTSGTDILFAPQMDVDYSYMAAEGHRSIETRFNGADTFGDGLVMVKVGNKCGFMNKQGLMVIAPMFDEAANFDGSTARVRIGKEVGYVDKTGVQLDKVKYVFTTRV
jgi:hypothetical protein